MNKFYSVLLACMVLFLTFSCDKNDQVKVTSLKFFNNSIKLDIPNTYKKDESYESQNGYRYHDAKRNSSIVCSKLPKIFSTIETAQSMMSSEALAKNAKILNYKFDKIDGYETYFQEAEIGINGKDMFKTVEYILTEKDLFVIQYLCPVNIAEDMKSERSQIYGSISVLAKK